MLRDHTVLRFHLKLNPQNRMDLTMRKFLSACLIVVAFGSVWTLGQDRGAEVRRVKQLPSKEKRWALIIGVDKYSNGIQQLYGAVNDAKALKDALVKYADFPENQIAVLTTANEDEQPTRTNIISRLYGLKRAVPKDGLFLFAFAGHGTERNQQVFLFPSDIRLSMNPEELIETAISVDKIKRQIEDAEIQQVVIFLDSCRNDPESGRGDKDNPLTEAYRTAFSFEIRNRGIEAFATIYATSFGRRAYEFKDKESGLQRGFFTWALAKGLAGEAASSDGQVTLGGLISFLDEAVPKKLKEENVNGEQKPYSIIQGYKASELVFALGKKGGAAAGDKPGVQFYLDRGMAFLKEEKRDEAINEYDQAIKLDPKNVEAYLYRGNAYDEKGDDDQAITNFDRVIALDAGHSIAYFYRGNAYGYKKMNDRAIEDYNKAIKLNSKFDEAFVSRGMSFYEKGDIKQALKDYDAALRINPKLGRAYFNRGLAKDEIGELEDALEDYGNVISLEPDNINAHYQRAWVYAAKGNFPKALNDLSRYLTFQPKDVDALYRRASVYVLIGNNNDALTDLTTAIELEPNSGRLYSLRGSIQHNKRDDAKAFADYQRALELEPEDIGAIIGREHLLF